MFRVYSAAKAAVRSERKDPMPYTFPRGRLTRTTMQAASMEEMLAGSPEGGSPSVQNAVTKLVAGGERSRSNAR